MNTISIEMTLSAVPSLSEADLARAQRELRSGHLLVVLTDTIYGIGVDAANPEAVAAVLAAKGCRRQMPPPALIVPVDVIDLLCVDIPEAARTLVHVFWSGGLILILRARPDPGWDLGETGGIIDVRVPNQAALLCLLHDFGLMAITSANLTGRPPATSAEQAVGHFGTGVSTYLDGGPIQGSTASSIVDFAHETPRVLRFGTIFPDDLSVTAGVPIAPVEGVAS